MKKKKILLALMVLNIGGVETHVVEFAIGLTKAGYIPIVVSNGGVYVKVLEEVGIKHYRVPLYNKSIANLVKSYQVLEKIIVEEKIDLVHAHARIPAFLLGLLQKKLKFPYVTTAHWVFKTDFLLKRISNWGQATIAVSEDIKKYLMREYKLPEKQISLTINGISTERFSEGVDTETIQKEFSITPENVHVVYISRLDADRSLYAHFLLAVAERLHARFPLVDYVIVGGGNDFEAIRAKAQEVNEKVGKTLIHMTNARTDVNAFVALSDVFIGVSRSVLEGMAAAKPVIVAGNEGELGIFTKEKLDSAVLSNFTCRGEKLGSVETLEKDLVTLLSATDEERKALGDYGKEVVLTHYSVERMTNDCTKIYEQFLGKTEGGTTHV